LSAHLFDPLNEVRDITAEWIERYNEIRPHDAPGSLPPAQYRERLLAADRRTRHDAARTVSVEWPSKASARRQSWRDQASHQRRPLEVGR